MNIQFKYVPTKENVADIVTRGLSYGAFCQELDFWLNGPSFINEKPISWPSNNLGCLSQASKELTCNVAVHKSENFVFDLNKYSKLNNLVSVLGYVIEFCHKIMKKFTSRLECLKLSKIYLIRYDQKVSFQSELDFLSGTADSPMPTLVQNLNLFIDEFGILRSKGRISKCSSLSYDVANPILMPNNSHLSELFIWDCHFRVKHMGTSSTLNTLRNLGLWITNGRTTIKKVLKKCIVCKKLNTLSFRYPKRTDFIVDRVNFSRPYQHTGIDFTGAINVKFGDTVSKMYLLIFTCLNIRSIHVEIVSSMATESFLLAFVKFCNLHNIPDKIYSDNALTFTFGVDIVSKSRLQCSFNEYLEKNNIKHVKIALYAAWMGSSWERMIKTLKSVLYKSIGRRRIEYFQLASLITEIQNMINSRPLTYRDDDVSNFDIITPNSFLKPYPSKNILFSYDEEFSQPTRDVLVRSLQNRDKLIEKSLELWHESYLTSLRETSQNLYENNWVNKIDVNDIVLISDPVKTRPFWDMGRVTELFEGSDGRVRSVKVVRKNRSEGTYPINLLYPLELSLSEIECANPDSSTAEADLNPIPSTAEEVPEARPERLAAKKCKKILRKCN